MISFQRMTLRERILCRISPSARRRRDAAIRKALDDLMADPAMPCMVEGIFVQDGYGTIVRDAYGTGHWP